MILERFRAEHLGEIRLQSAQAYLRATIDEEYARMLEGAGPAYTARCQHGQIAACAGFLDAEDLLFAWAFLAPCAARHLVRLNAMVRRALATAWRPVIGATVEADFPQGARWLQMLGFQRVTVLKEYGPDGRDHFLYERRAS